MKTYYSIRPASYYSILEIKANKPYDVIDSILGSRDGNEVLPADTKFRIMQGKRATPMIFYHESISIKFFSQKFIQFLSQFIDMSDKCYPIEIEDFDETYYVIYNLRAYESFNCDEHLFGPEPVLFYDEGENKLPKVFGCKNALLIAVDKEVRWAIERSEFAKHIKFVELYSYSAIEYEAWKKYWGK